MDTQTLTHFAETARLGSFSAVARQQGVDPSSISRSIATLEAELGLRLFQRTTRRLSLTEAGERYFARIAPLCDELTRAADEARATASSPQGTLRLTCSVSFGQICIVPLMADFRRQFPDLRLALLLSDAPLDLVAERIDLAIRHSPAPDSTLIGTRLMTMRYRVVASPAWAAAHPLNAPAALSDHPVLRFALPDFDRRWLFRDPQGTLTEVPVHGDITISNALALRAAAIQGLGPTLLGDRMIQAQLSDGTLVDLFPDHDVTATTFDPGIWALYPSRSYLPTKTRVTLDFLRTRLD